jgi:hypothetical protein
MADRAIDSETICKADKMTERFRLLEAIVVIGLMACTPMSITRTGSAPIRSRVCVSSEERALLNFTLENVASGPLKIEASNLPWVSWYPARITVHDQISAESIEPVQLIDDPPPPTVETVESGGTLTGSVDLTSYFPSLIELNRDRPLVIRWLFDVKTLDMPNVPVEGSLTIAPQGLVSGRSQCTP